MSEQMPLTHMYPPQQGSSTQESPRPWQPGGGSAQIPLEHTNPLQHSPPDSQTAPIDVQLGITHWPAVQTEPAAQSPQATVPLQPSDMSPQVTPMSAQLTGMQFAVQTPSTHPSSAQQMVLRQLSPSFAHRRGVIDVQLPELLHVWPGWQPPHETMPPQPSVASPQVRSRSRQVAGMHRSTQTPCSHSSLPGQLPHHSMPPHLSSAGPHETRRSSQVRGRHESTHVPSMHCWTSPQSPQVTVVPHPVFSDPHDCPAAAQVRGTHGSAQAPLTQIKPAQQVAVGQASPTPPQLEGVQALRTHWYPEPQFPQSRKPPQPSATEPHMAPMDEQVLGTHGGVQVLASQTRPDTQSPVITHISPILAAGRQSMSAISPAAQAQSGSSQAQS
ncbi:MAG: hypothetical protein ACR2J8_14965 [Thermomicrobiales bacterium]